MESMTKFVSSWSNSWESAASRTTGVVGNPRLAAGLLLGYFLLGLIIVILAFCTQCKRLSVFNQSIILGDGASLGTYSYSYEMVYTVWFLSKSCVIVLHLLCALLSVLHLCHPHWRVQLWIIASVVAVLTAVFVVLRYYLPLVGFIGLAVITFGLALAIIAKSFGSTASPSAAASKRWIVFVAMFTFLVIYLPILVLDCLRINDFYNTDYDVIYLNLLYYTNIQLALDGILCLLILRLPAEVEEEQQPQFSFIQIHPYYSKSII